MKKLQLTQLLLFPEEQKLVSYWHFPFDDKGNYIKNRMDNFTEYVQETRLPEFINMLQVIGAVGIKIY
jgi:hypothetical protein